MPKESEDIIFQGRVTHMSRGDIIVRVGEGDDEEDVICKIAGKLRKFRIKIILGDVVDVAVSPYDMSRGRIVYRHKN